MLGDGEFQTVYLLWNVANSMLQLPIAYWADRRDARWLVWAGPIVGTACVGCVGFADSFGALCLLLMSGGVGMAAFHPEAAAALPENRTVHYNDSRCFNTLCTDPRSCVEGGAIFGGLPLGLYAFMSAVERRRNRSDT